MLCFRIASGVVPDAKTLNATAWGNRGNFHLGGAAVNWHDDQVISTKVDSKA